MELLLIRHALPVRRELVDGAAELPGAVPEPPEPQTDEALAAVDRVVLRISIERVTAVTHMQAR
jgi:hypothetical protein